MRVGERRPELVIFDCDGVLVDSERISNDVLARMLSDEGLPKTLTDARRDYQGLLLGDIARAAEAELGRSLPAGWLERYEHTRAEAFRLELRAVPGAAETVARVNAAGIEVCVASQGKVVVEDTPSGVTAAVAARMRVLGYAADSDEGALRRAGAEIMDAMEELPGRLGLG